MNYPESLPCPIRSRYARDLDFNTVQAPMQSGYIIQRRMEPYIFRQIDLGWDMRIAEFHQWWDWVHRYAFSWHTMPIQGEDVKLRYITPVDFSYRVYGVVSVSVRAEVQAQEDTELWTGDAPTFYDPPINDDDGTVDGSVTPDIDLNTSFEPYDVTLDTVPKEYNLRTSTRINGIGTIYVYGAPGFELRTLDGVTVLATTETDYIRWHTDPDRTDDMLKLVAGEDYLLRISGTVDDVVTIWGTTAWL